MKKISKSEAGKLGALASKNYWNKLKQDNINEYNLNPKKCAHEKCKNILDYEHRFNKYCSRSCAVTINNTKTKTKANKSCLNCQKDIKSDKYCSNQCQSNFKFKKKIEEWKKDNSIKIDTRTLKRYLTEKYGYKCSIVDCGISDWCGKKLVLELEHIDGNHLNNEESNICLICPNCHTQTLTYKGKNAGNGRYYRKKRYQEGKSY
jgi:hypothetical protein